MTQTMSQLSLDDAFAAADEGVSSAHRNADQRWLDDAYRSVVDWLGTHPLWFCDDWWAESEITEPREARALGAVVRRVSREGLMVKSGSFRPSVRSHGQPKPVWRSEVCSL